MNNQIGQEECSNLGSQWPEVTQRYQQAWRDGETVRLQLALELADKEYHYPTCELVGSKAERRSFCFTHQQLTKKAVLLIHGFTACPFEMRELGRSLFEQGYNVFGTRLAGHGTSVMDFANSNRNDWESSARKGLAIAALLGYEIVVVGESMGGALAVLLAQAFPTLIQQLILCAPCFQIKDFRTSFAGWQLLQRFMPYYSTKVQYGWQYDYWYTTIPLTTVAELVKLARVASRAGPGITMPTLVIQAENDQTVNPRGARCFFNSLSQLTPDQKELILFSNGHHNLTVDLNPRKAEVFQWISHFIQKMK
ncbi:MAG TPA: alpha/beta fold hydrolase [Bacillota bacterium]